MTISERKRFKKMDNKDRIEFLKSKQRHGKPKTGKVDKSLNKTYNRWKPVEDMKRSFFVKIGKFSNSPKEAEIAWILKAENLRYYREVSFDLKKRFDFYIPLIDLIIEYDGSQHFTEFKEIYNDKEKELILNRLGIKYIRYNKTHNLSEQIKHDLIHHPILKYGNKINS